MRNVNDVLKRRKIINGERSKLMMVRPVKHQFARDLLRIMINNTWGTDEVDLTGDKLQYESGVLTDGELTAYKRALAFVSNLDGIQLNNLTNNINQHVTSPEVNQCLVRQAWEEALHVEAYATMIETIGFDPLEVYFMYEDDPLLAEKNAYIMRQSEILGDGFSEDNYVLACAANIALEGIYFYSAFLTFYTLSRQNKMVGSAKMIKLIQRDERTHLHLFVTKWKSLVSECPNAFRPSQLKKVREIFRLAAALEATWGSHIIQGGVLGLTDEIFEQFCAYRADECMRLIGLDPIFNTKNPVPWFDKYAQVNEADQNFFETKVDNYSSELDW